MSRLCAVVLIIGVSAWAAPGWSQADQPDTPPTGPKTGAAPTETATADEPAEPSDSTSTKRSAKTWEEIVADFLKVRPFPKDKILRIDDQYCYPNRAVSFKMEIVREDEDTVWLRGLPPEDPESALHKLWLRREAEQRDLLTRRELASEYDLRPYDLDFRAEVPPPPFMDSLSFTAAPGTMPSDGRWQMNFAVDDMNGDGVDDLVFPPTRKGSSHTPFIFLGKGNGEFVLARDLTWSTEVPFDYGGVATGDFDGDGHRDIVLAIHFKAQYVLFGDGKGGFSRSQRLPNPDPRMTSRAVAVADFDGDGRDDVAFQAEIDVDLATNERIEDAPTVWVVLNRENGWRVETEGLPYGVIGDNLSAVDVDRDGRPDLVVAPGSLDWRALVYFNRGDDGWQRISKWEGVLSHAYHVDIADYSGDDGEQLFATFTHFRMIDGKTRALTGLISYRLGAEGLESPSGPIFYDDDRFNPVFRVAVGDLTGDGRPDVVVGRKKGGLMVFVQTESGDFYLEQSPELDGVGCAYDIRLLDLNGDGRDDMIASFAPVEELPGGVRVWLTGGRG